MSLIHELWLGCNCKFEPELIKKYIDKFGSAEEIYKADPDEVKNFPVYGSYGNPFKFDRSLFCAEEILEACYHQDIRIISLEDEDYPNRLKNISMPPRILFVKGEWLDFDNYLPISIVGCRAATRNGREFTRKLAHDLAVSGFIIISGMAKGIDAEAHKGAISAGNKTFAVLAGGPDIIYPTENKDIYCKIIENGAIISERPPGTIGKPYFYEQRNRIVAGMSVGTVIVEGKESSGAAITARHAGESNRDLFAVPNNPLVLQSALPNSLISDGAKLVSDALDVLETYTSVYPELLGNGLKFVRKDEECAPTELEYTLDETDKKIIKFLKSSGDARFPDEICVACDIPINIVSGKLTMLTLYGILKQEPGNKYLLTGGNLT